LTFGARDLISACSEADDEFSRRLPMRRPYYTSYTNLARDFYRLAPAGQIAST